jgi:hypothetical protein
MWRFLRRNLVTDVSSDYTIPAFSRHATIYISQPTVLCCCWICLKLLGGIYRKCLTWYVDMWIKAVELPTQTYQISTLVTFWFQIRAFHTIALNWSDQYWYFVRDCFEKEKDNEPFYSSQPESHSMINTNYISYIHIEILSALTEQTRCTEAKESPLVLKLRSLN